MNTLKVIKETHFHDLKLLKRGKVRDIYEGNKYLLIVATDRISAFDVVMNEGIPYKGKVLTQISSFWFNFTKHIIENHVIYTNVDDYPDICLKYKDVLEDRSMVVIKTKPLEIECIVRGYISGSGWKEYQEKQSICGIKLRKGLNESDKLDEPIFTPSTKAEIGIHDQNITFKKASEMIGNRLAKKIRDVSIEIYKNAHDYAYEKGIIIADTKLEFGLFGDTLVLIDELLTPDSSRFWSKEKYLPGKGQESYDKQFLRDYLNSLNWNKEPPPPNLPDDVVDITSKKYLEAFRTITGENITNG